MLSLKELEDNSCRSNINLHLDTRKTSTSQVFPLGGGRCGTFLVNTDIIDIDPGRVVCGCGGAGAIDPRTTDLHREDKVKILVKRPLFCAFFRHLGIGQSRLAIDRKNNLLAVPLAPISVPIIKLNINAVMLAINVTFKPDKISL